MARTIEPLPSTGISKILGMCEILDDKGGREDTFALARDLHMPFSEVLLVIKAAEMLALIDTPGHEAQLTAFGKSVLAAPIHEKKKMLGEQMLKLNVFQHVVKLLQGNDRGELPAELILEELEREFGRRGRLQRLTVGMLRETRMPAVQVEPLVTTNELEASLIDDEGFAPRVARAVAGGARRFFG